jgi:hypothetical protein
VGETFERDGLPVADELGNCLRQGDDLCHQLRPSTGSLTAAVILTPAPRLPLEGD